MFTDGMTTTHVIDCRSESTGYPIHFDGEFTGSIRDAEGLAQRLANQSPQSAVMLYVDGEHLTTVQPTDHRTRVSRGAHSTYVVICDVCNTVGQPQEFEADAEGIAARHQEIGGFER